MWKVELLEEILLHEKNGGFFNLFLYFTYVKATKMKGLRKIWKKKEERGYIGEIIKRCNY